MTELQQVMNLAIENWDDTLRKNAFNLPYASLPINGLIYGHGIEQFTIPELAGVMQRWTFAKLSTRSPKDFCVMVVSLSSLTLRRKSLMLCLPLSGALMIYAALQGKALHQCCIYSNGVILTRFVSSAALSKNAS
jgi:hypothetical protein